jgi:long-chain acyl-CoA synthetase
MRHQFKDAGVRALVYLNLFGSRVQEVCNDTEIDYLIEAKMGDFLPAAKGWLVNTVVDKVKIACRARCHSSVPCAWARAWR